MEIMKNQTIITGQTELDKYLDLFPNNAKTWADATDEVRDIARIVRDSYNELTLDVLEGENGFINAIDYRSLSTPSQWNTEYKNQIKMVWGMMNEYSKEYAMESIKRSFLEIV